MMLSDESESGHPYLYARIVDIFHAEVGYKEPGRSICKFNRMEILWVRWFTFDSSFPCGFAAKRLPRIQFVQHTDDDMDTFGFLNPDYILRGAHLIPAFSQGRTNDLLPPSIVRGDSENHED